MGDSLILERFQWFDHLVRNNRFPNAATLAGYFGFAPKTAQRSIDFMRDRLAAPLEYNASRKGYCYTDAGYELPRRQVEPHHAFLTENPESPPARGRGLKLVSLDLE